VTEAFPLSNPDELLDSLEANNRARLGQARSDEAVAAEIVPQLVELLGNAKRKVVLRALGALMVIGPAARGALAAVLPHLMSSNLKVAEMAAYAIGTLDAGAAAGPLVAAFRPGLEKPVMFALCRLGPAAREAAPLFARAFRHSAPSVREMALCGLKEIQAPTPIIEAVVAQARTDRFQVVRERARNLFPLQADAEPSTAPVHRPPGWLRCIFGNPFRSAPLGPDRRSPTITALARAAHDECSLPSGELDSTRLGVLADALEEAGWTEEALLEHLRDPGPHVRGCWAVGLVLAKG
jgi:hypothetical protein